MLAPHRVGFLHEGGNHWRELIAREEFAGVIEKLRAPFFVIREDGVELGFAGKADDAFVEFVGGPESLRIPRGDLAKHPAAVFLAKNLDHQIKMAAHDADAFVKTWFGREI